MLRVALLLAVAISLRSADSLSSLGTLNRAELQALAKKNGIKANLASAEIIRQLEAAKPGAPIPVAAAKPKTAVADTRAKSKPDIQLLLAEQGIEVKDLIDLRKTIQVESKQKLAEADPVKAMAKSAANAAVSKAIKTAKASSIDKSSSKQSVPPATKSSLPVPRSSTPPVVATAIPVIPVPRTASPFLSVAQQQRLLQSRAQATATATATATAPATQTETETALVPAATPVPAQVVTPSEPAFSGWTPHFAAQQQKWTTTTPSSTGSRPSSRPSSSSSSSSSAAHSLDGVTLEMMLTALVKKIGYDGLYSRTR